VSVVVDSVDGGGDVCLVSSCRWCAFFFLNYRDATRMGFWIIFGYSASSSVLLLDRSTWLLLSNERKQLVCEFAEDCINV
jgi:hypothetical protein